MNKMIRENIVSTEMLKENICRIRFRSQELAKHAQPGQFVNVRCNKGYYPLLRRPMSICDVERSTGMVSMVFMAKSEGTRMLAKMEVGETLDILAPLGNGFQVGGYSKILAVGGGLGVFPLYFLLKESQANYKGCILGFRNEELVVMEEEFETVSDSLKILTDDGSVGEQGTVADGLLDYIRDNGIEVVYTCGPMAMIQSVSKIAQEAGVPCQVSVEERMACGIGACLVCACKARKHRGAIDDAGEFVYKHVCKDGPVFWSDELIFE